MYLDWETLLKISQNIYLNNNLDCGCRFRRIASKGIRLAIAITTKCNLKCSHCFATLNNNELSVNEWLKITSQLPDINVSKLIITGGEPLMISNLEQIILLSSKNGIAIDLNSNLNSMTQRRAESLMAAGLKEISASLDGCKDFHDSIRNKPGNFFKVINNIKLLKRLGYKVDIHSASIPSNLKSLPELIDICADLEVSSLTLISILPKGKALLQFNLSELSWNQKSIEVLKKILFEKRATYNNFMPIRTVGILVKPIIEECKMGNDILGITPDGYLLGCLLSNQNNRVKIVGSTLKSSYITLLNNIKRVRHSIECL
jgi:MoaA/NifB/PqqE/SkfB family radical SAM enzyme